MKLIKCKSLFSKIRGLMFRFSYDGAIFINKKPKKIDLHTFFVFYPIDILFLDENFKIIKIYKKVRPFRFYIPGTKSKYIIELKESLDLNVGDKFKIHCSKYL